MDGPPFAADSHQPALWHLDAARGPSTPSLDYLVGAGRQRRRHFQAEGSCGRQVDDELEFARLNHRQVGRLLAFEDATSIDTGLPEAIRQVRTIAHQTTGFRIVP